MATEQHTSRSSDVATSTAADERHVDEIQGHHYLRGVMGSENGGSTVTLLADQRHEEGIREGEECKARSTPSLTTKEKTKLEKKLKRRLKREAISKGLMDFLSIIDHVSASPINEEQADEVLTTKNKTQAKPTARNKRQQEDGGDGNQTDDGEDKLSKQKSSVETADHLFLGHQNAGWQKEDNMMEAPKVPTGQLTVDLVVDGDVDFFDMKVFGDETFFERVTKRIHVDAKSLSVTEWQPQDVGCCSEEDRSGLPQRRITYGFTKNISFIKYNVAIDQVQTRLLSVPGQFYVIEAISMQSGIPYSDYFQVRNHFQLENFDPQGSGENKEGPCGKTRIRIVSELQFFKPCILKGKIESETYNGLKTFGETFKQELLQICKLHVEDEDVVSVDEEGGSRMMAPPAEGDEQSGGEDTRLVLGRKTSLRPLSKICDQNTVILMTMASMLVIMLLTTFAMYKMVAAMTALCDRLVLGRELA